MSFFAAQRLIDLSIVAGFGALCLSGNLISDWWARKKAERRDFEAYMQREATLAALGRVTGPRCVPDLRPGPSRHTRRAPRRARSVDRLDPPTASNRLRSATPGRA